MKVMVKTASKNVVYHLHGLINLVLPGSSRAVAEQHQALFQTASAPSAGCNKI